MIHDSTESEFEADRNGVIEEIAYHGRLATASL